MPSPRGLSVHQLAGFSYTEVLIAIVLIVIALVPAMQALQPAMISTNGQQGLLSNEQLLKNKMEELLAIPYDALSSAAMASRNNATAPIPPPFSDTATGIVVHLYRYDLANPSTPAGTDKNMIWLQVELPMFSNKLTTLRAPLGQAKCVAVDNTG